MKYICVPMQPCQLLFSFRHTDEMIEKLKTAGLGYYVKDDSTQQKFGMQLCKLSMCIVMYF